MAALGHGVDLKLRAEHSADIVHGSVTIVHNSPPIPHEVRVELYDADEDPCERHVTIFRCPENMPSTAELKQRAIVGW